YRSTLPKLQTPRQPGKRSIADLPPCGAGIRVTTKAYAKRKRSRRKDSNVFTRTSPTKRKGDHMITVIKNLVRLWNQWAAWQCYKSNCRAYGYSYISWHEWKRTNLRM